MHLDVGQKKAEDRLLAAFTAHRQLGKPRPRWTHAREKYLVSALRGSEGLNEMNVVSC